jgi:hypothetical protein
MNLYKPLGVRVTQLAYSLIYYSTTNLTTKMTHFGWGNFINSTSSGKTVTTGSNLPHIPSEYFAGLSFFKPIDDDSVLDFQIDLILDLNTKIIIYPQNPYNASQYGSSSTLTGYFYVMSALCGYTNVYNLLDGNCYGGCPIGFLLGMVCYTCPHDCLNCS